jgi:thiol:disulfide interchange protein DsbD
MTIQSASSSVNSCLWRALCLLGLLLLAACNVRAATDDFLEPEQAFRFSARALDEHRVEVAFDIAPGYYLYRERFAIAAGDGAVVADAVYPHGKVKFDETFQKQVETFRDHLSIVVPVTRAQGAFHLNVTSQGCADRGLCYPPMTSVARVNLAGFGGDGSVAVQGARDAHGTAAGALKASTDRGTVASSGNALTAPLDSALRERRLWSVVGVFFVAGLLLSLTPCVLPMVPILSSIIVGHCRVSTRLRGLMLAIAYSMGLALVYTLLGVAAGLAGEGLAATLQAPWILAAFATVLALLSLSMFGLYELQLPSRMVGKLTQLVRRLPGGHVSGVFLMGGISALIVSPCVAAPLAGALVYISRTRDVLVGGTALFALAMGMSMPLLLVGASAGALLPRAGRWMVGVKRFFGVALLGVAVWMLQPLIAAAASLFLWGALCALAAVLAGLFSRRSAWPIRVASAAVLAMGVLQWIGAASGGGDPLRPLAHLMPREAPSADTPAFQAVASVAELEAAVRQAGRPIILDFYADWCVSCREMERYTFSDPAIAKRMAGALLLKADVTRNNADDRELLRRFGLFGPPGTIFFDARGREIAGSRVIGYQASSRFADALSIAGL